MSTCITISFWPSCLDNMRWSRDNLIAVAGNDSIAVLVPKLGMKATSDPKWDHAVLKVNGFTQKELPLREPISFVNWSVGEEMSLRYVLSMDWSPPGLGCFNTCVLAILHSDYALDIWEYTGRPDSRDSWRRCLIITTAVHNYYESLYPIPAKQQQSDMEQRQVRQRIRSFAWAPQLSEGSTEALRSCEDSISAQTVQLLAVSTEAGDILILRVQSPYNILSDQKQEWHAAVQHSIACSQYMPSLDHSHFPRPPAGHSRSDYPVIEELLWTEVADAQQYVLAFIVDGILCTIYFDPPDNFPSSNNAEQSNLKVTPHQLTPPGMVMEGPLRLSSDGTMLTCFAGDVLVAHKLSSSDLTEVEYETHRIDRRWSEISGLVIMPHSASSARAVFTTHLGYERLQQDMIVLSSSKDTGAPIAVTTQDALRDAAQEYSSKHSLTAGTHTRTWGITASPTSSDVAICSTLLPADSVAHIIQSDQECYVFICALAQFDHPDYSTPSVSLQWDAVESLIFALQSRVLAAKASAPDAEPDTLLFRSSINRNLSQPTLLVHADYGDILDRSPVAAATHRLQTRVLHRSDRYADMQQRLLACALRESYSSLMPKDWYQALTEEVQSIAVDLSGGQLSRRILSMYKLVLHKLVQARNNEEQGNRTGNHADEEPTNRNDTKEKANAERVAQGDTNGSHIVGKRVNGQHIIHEGMIESCGVCHESMPFEAMRWARCSSGHTFVRCALTFLAIPRPGISKSCSVCGAQYLNEQQLCEFGTNSQIAGHNGLEFLDRMATVGADADGHHTMSGSRAIEPSSSLARVLFSVFHKCLLCSGRFTA